MEAGMDHLFSDEDLKDLLDEFEESTANEELEDEEMNASNRRYEEIIKKHKDE